MKKPSILIVEDVSILAMDIADRVTSWGNESVGPFSSGEEAMRYVATMTEEPDLAILDIELSGAMTGIELARRLNENRILPIIYLTKQQDDQTLNDVLKTGFSYFLCKPFQNSELRAAIFKALETRKEFALNEINIDDKLTDRIFVRNGTGQYHILLEDIILIEANGEATKLIVLNKEQPITVSSNLGRVLDKLSFSGLFQRANRFHAVNINRVQRINRSKSGVFQEKERSKRFLILQDWETQIDLSEKYRSLFLERLNFL